MANHTDWLNISTMSGSSGQTILTLTANTNLQSEDKVAIVKAYNPVYNVSATTTVRISAYTPYITVSPDMVGIPASGGTYQFSIQANCSYTIAYPEMVTDYSASGGTGNTNITFTVPSTSESATVVGNIVLTDITSQYSTTLRLEQYGQGAVIQINPTAVTIPFSGGTGNFTVSANCIYTISKGSGTWYSVSPESGYTGSTVFTVSAGTVNTGTTDWNDTISVVGPDGVAGTVATTQQNPGSRVINYTADTSTVASSGEVRTITIDSTDFINSSITVNIVGATGATYTYNQQSTTRGVITVTFSENTGAPRDYTVVVTGRRAMTTYTATASIPYTQTEYVTVPIAYTADTSEVAASGETRTITIDASNLVASSITIGVAGATGVTYTYGNGIITISFPENYGAARDITLNIDGKTTNGDNAEADITFSQEAGNPLGKYLTFKIISGGTILWRAGNSAFTRTIEYKKNNGNWTSLTSNTGASAPSISVNAGDIVKFRGDNAAYSDISGRNNSFSGTTAKFEVEGNIMSLIDSENFATATTLASSYTFASLFRYCTGLTSAENLLLPATTLASGCYEGMFYGCSSLTTAPELPATVLTYACYDSMFGRCTSLSTAPALSATTLAQSCYRFIFNRCTSLTTAPELPATTLAEGCYTNMFFGCTSLTTAPALPATTLVDYCYSQMFYDCTSLTAAPELPAATLTEGCYENMFQGCTSLNYIKCLATDISADYSTSHWVDGVASAGTFVKAGSMNDWEIDSVNGIPIGWTVQDDWGGLDEYLTFNIISGGTIVWKHSNSGVARTIQYKKNDGNWSNITSSTGGASISVDAGDVLQFRGDNARYGTSTYKYGFFGSSGAKFEAEGNIMSLIDSENFLTATTLTTTFSFFGLFNNCGGLKDASNLLLPATTLTTSCYDHMFKGCTSLTAAPELPAARLASYCCRSMFQGCTSLATAPALPATTLANDCYYEMFQGCTSLTTAPELPATTLAQYCYYQMFLGCTRLSSTQGIFATTLAGASCTSMFEGCTSLATAPELPATTLAQNCYKKMFSGCTSLTSVPELPATKTAEGCYDSMFEGCRNLHYIKCLATDISAGGTTRWTYGVSSTGTFVKAASMTSWTRGYNGIPSPWTVQDAT